MKKISILLISILFLAACGIKGDITGKTFNMNLNH
ncbi:LPS translocon maturation chaperone LptM [Macrococcoides canis]|nr:lipoprotein [Macrococcus canis]